MNTESVSTQNARDESRDGPPVQSIEGESRPAPAKRQRPRRGGLDHPGYQAIGGTRLGYNNGKTSKI